MMNLNNFKLLKEDSNSYHVGHPNGKKLVIDKQGLSDKAHEAIKKIKGPQKFADGGMSYQQDPDIPGVNDNVDYSSAVMPQPESNKYGDLYDQTYTNQHMFNPGQPDLINRQIALDAATRSKGADEASEHRAEVAQQFKDQQLASQDKDRIALGLAPLQHLQASNDIPINPGQNSGISDAGINTSNLPSQIMPQDQMGGPYQAQMNANTEIGEIQNREAQAQEAALGHLNHQLETMPSQNDIMNEYHKKNQALEAQYANHPEIDPFRVIHNMSTGNKILAGIGLLFGGQNAASLVQNAINNDIDAQRNSQDKTMNLWKMNRQALGDDLSANLATQNQMLVGVKYKLAQAEAQASGPLARQRAAMGNAQIQQQLNMNNAILGFMHGSPGNEGDYNMKLSYMQRIDPAVYKDAQSKYLPGIGVASVPVTEKDRESIVKMDDFQKNLDHAIALQNQFGKSGAWSPENRAKAQEIKARLITGLNDLTGLNRFTENEAGFYKDVIGDIGSVNAGGPTIHLNELQREAYGRRLTLMNNLGVKPFGQKPSSPSLNPQPVAVMNGR